VRSRALAAAAMVAPGRYQIIDQQDSGAVQELVGAVECAGQIPKFGQGQGRTGQLVCRAKRTADSQTCRAEHCLCGSVAGRTGPKQGLSEAVLQRAQRGRQGTAHMVDLHRVLACPTIAFM
jgi:hypothetical protein